MYGEFIDYYSKELDGKLGKKERKKEGKLGRQIWECIEKIKKREENEKERT